MKILIADDELNNRILLKKILEPLADCDMVVNGKEAVEFFEMQLTDSDPYHLILLDIMMPEMDGQVALKQIREIEQQHAIPPRGEVVIFMVTALDTPKDVFEAFNKGGCTDYLTKPVDRQALLDKMREYKLL